jgi:hypothetical protein
MSLKMFLDDVRPCPAGWHPVRSVQEAKTFVKQNAGKIVAMSLDHDLGICYCTPCLFQSGEEPCQDVNGAIVCDCECRHENAPSGYDFLVWIAETGNWPTFPPTVHSANPVGAQNMRNFISDWGPYEE